jgi:hypothetical protein
MNNLFTALRSKGVQVSLAVSALVVASSAHAALPTWATSAATTLGGNVSDYENLVGPIILAVTAAVVGIKLFKRFTAKI